jgi:two-component system chemotaxis sensor kinase CheA
MGIQRDRIIHKALERGLLTQNDLAGGISDEGLFDLLFLDGFSTTPIINEISGRGVGLNVVRSVVHSLKGKVTTESLAGEGTSFCISLPVTTAITDGFVVSYAGQQYILPAENIKEFFAFEQLELIQVENRGQMIKIRDEFVTFLSLGDLVGSCSQQKGLIVLVEYDKKTWALRVDEVIGKSQIVMKGINELLGDTYGIIGTAVLGNGKIGFVIDIGDMIAASVAKGTSLPK